MMLADRSFQQQFTKQHGAMIQSLDLAKRQVIELKNPLLPPLAPLRRKELWFHPTGSKGKRTP